MSNLTAINPIMRDGCRVKACDKNIMRTLQLTKEMMRLADEGDADRDDTGCGILYGIMRDSAYKLKKLAEVEKSKHLKKGGWRDPAG